MTMRPPPLPPFREAVEIDTEPGAGLLALKQENARLRAALAKETAPPLPGLRVTRAQIVGLCATGGTVLALLAPLVGRYVPQYSELVASIADLLDKLKGAF